MKHPHSRTEGKSDLPEQAVFFLEETEKSVPMNYSNYLPVVTQLQS